MKKILLTIIISTVLFSCTSNKQAKDPDKIRKEISKYKSQIRELEGKIAKLEEELSGLNQTENAVKAIRVNTLVLKGHKFEHYFMATGTVRADNEAYISPQTNGQITGIYVEEGDKVKKGQLLARLDTDIIERNIEEVKVSLQLAETIYKKQKDLWSKQIGSEIQYLQAKSNYESLQSKLKTLRSRYDKSFIKSPLNGVVDVIYQKVGEMGTPGMRLVHVVSLSPLLVKAQVSEKYIPVIKVGDLVTVTFPTFPGMKIDASITRIGNVINPANRTFTVEFKLNNEDLKIKPNMLATLIIKDYQSENSITVPSFLVREDLKGSYVYIVENENGVLKATKRYIKTGLSYENNTQVLSGLKAGDTVVTDGYNNVSDGVVVTTK